MLRAIALLLVAAFAGGSAARGEVPLIWEAHFAPDDGEETCASALAVSQGRLLATGTPEEIAGVPDSYTGQFLADLVEPEIKVSRAKGKRRAAAAA